MKNKIFFSSFLLLMFFCLSFYSVNAGTVPRQGKCDSNADCQSGLVCVSCASQGAKCLGNMCWSGGNAEVGGTGLPDAEIAPSMFPTTGGTATSCLSSEAPCDRDSECCSQICNPDSGKCTGNGSAAPTCISTGAPCDRDSECCSQNCNPNTGTCNGAGGGTTGSETYQDKYPTNKTTPGLPGDGPGTSGTKMNGIEIPQNTGLPNPPGGIKAILTNILTWLLGIVGIIALIGFAISGIQYLISTGDEGMIDRAKTNMTYSIIGMVVVLASFVIIQAIQYALQARSF